MQVSSYIKSTRVKQVMADLALSNVSNRNVESLTQSEHRRVAIGVQLVRDPVVLLLDEPTADLDPLNTYFVISILANHAKKYNRIVLLTMEKPRDSIKYTLESSQKCSRKLSRKSYQNLILKNS